MANCQAPNRFRFQKELKTLQAKLQRQEINGLASEISANCAIYEIQHSDQIVPEQYRHLTDEEKCRQTERRFGKIVKRCVLYRGMDYETEEGIVYQTVEEYLKRLM